MAKSKLHIGTSGWSYNHWKENFYPPKLPNYKWLEFYASQFSTVEINSTFYRTPLTSTIKKWNETVPKDFQFAIKANRYITHLKRLNDCKKSMSIFYKSIQKLRPKIGPILFQLPPSFSVNQNRLEEFIGLLKKDYQYTFEFRHSTWFTDEIYNLLSKHKIALCITDLNGKLSPLELTGNFTYLRLHGPHKSYQGSYGPKKLKDWKNKIEHWLNHGIDVYCYFDNDEKGYAVEDAKFLLELYNQKEKI